MSGVEYNTSFNLTYLSIYILASFEGRKLRSDVNGSDIKAQIFYEFNNACLGWIS
jgi:hypothetical protein